MQHLLESSPFSDGRVHLDAISARVALGNLENQTFLCRPVVGTRCSLISFSHKNVLHDHSIEGDIPSYVH